MHYQSTHVSGTLTAHCCYRWILLFPFAVTHDLPEEDRTINSYSLVVSETEPTTGYYLPRDKDYIYRVQCNDGESCEFTKILTPGHKNPYLPVTMAIPDGKLGWEVTFILTLTPMIIFTQPNFHLFLPWFYNWRHLKWKKLIIFKNIN